MAIDIEILNCINISQYYSFYSIFNQVNAALVSIRDFFQKPKILNGSVHVIFLCKYLHFT